jgi:hypothetical protein
MKSADFEKRLGAPCIQHNSVHKPDKALELRVDRVQVEIIDIPLRYHQGKSREILRGILTLALGSAD